MTSPALSHDDEHELPFWKSVIIQIQFRQRRLEPSGM
jgi:hypothetical protein